SQVPPFQADVTARSGRQVVKIPLGVPVRGQLVAEGRPVANALVELDAQPTLRTVKPGLLDPWDAPALGHFEARSRSDGRFTFFALPEGWSGLLTVSHYFILASGLKAVDHLAVTAGCDLTIEVVPWQVVTGRV